MRCRAPTPRLRDSATPRPRDSAWAVVVAAGRGQRFGVPDKVFLPLAGRPLVAHALDAASAAAAVAGIVLVVGPHTRVAAEALAAGGAWPKLRAVVAGGERRQDSVAAGLAAVPAGVGVVLIHDGARPLADPDLFDRCARAAAEVGAAIAAVPVCDTLKRVDAAGLVVGTHPRDGLWAAQTPQGFRRDLLAEALASPQAAATFTDEAGLFETLGHPVAVVPGSPTNLKVTLPADLHLAEALLAGPERAAEASPSPVPALSGAVG